MRRRSPNDTTGRDEDRRSALIFVALLGEGTDVWRPVAAESLGHGRYRIAGTQPDDEPWEFHESDVVHCVPRRSADGSVHLTAVERAADPGGAGLMPAHALPSSWRPFLWSLIVVAASTIPLRNVGGYGTVLGTNVELGGGAAFAALSSEDFVSRHPALATGITALLNVALFGVPGALAMRLLGGRPPGIRGAVLLAWLMLYLACLFLWPRATDGP